MTITACIEEGVRIDGDLREEAIKELGAMLDRYNDLIEEERPRPAGEVIMDLGDLQEVNLLKRRLLEIDAALRG